MAGAGSEIEQEPGLEPGVIALLALGLAAGLRELPFEGLALSGNGKVVAGALRGAVPGYWSSATGLRKLPLPAGFSSCTTMGCSADGGAIVAEVSGRRGQELCYWKAGQLRGVLPLWGEAELKVSADGTAVLVSESTIFDPEHVTKRRAPETFCWRPGFGVRELQLLSAGEIQSALKRYGAVLGNPAEPEAEVGGCSANGDVVVGTVSVSSGTQRRSWMDGSLQPRVWCACYWDRSGRVFPMPNPAEARVWDCTKDGKHWVGFGKDGKFYVGRVSGDPGPFALTMPRKWEGEAQFALGGKAVVNYCPVHFGQRLVLKGYEWRLPDLTPRQVLSRRGAELVVGVSDDEKTLLLLSPSEGSSRSWLLVRD